MLYQAPRLAIALGNDPVILLSEKLGHPVSALNPDASREEGRVPVIWFLEMSIEARAVRLASQRGMVPVSPMFCAVILLGWRCRMKKAGGRRANCLAIIVGGRRRPPHSGLVGTNSRRTTGWSQ